MTDKKYIVALDQGTTSSRAVVMDHDANIVSVSQREFEQIYPKPGWVEHDPMEIWASQSSTLVEALAKADINSDQIAAIGITNQRETVVVWERETGKPIYNAIVWQCRRTAEICEQLKRDGMEEYIRKATGLVVDPYFSGTKVKWILDHVEGSRERAKRGELLFGTVDTLAYLEDDPGPRARHRLHQRLAYHAVQHSRPRLGRQDARRAGHSARHAAGSAQVFRSVRPDQHRW